MSCNFIALRMNVRIFRIIYIALLLQWSARLSAQILDSLIHTVQLYKQGWETSPPVIFLGTNDRLVLAFDDFSPQVRNLWYSFEHCNHNWETDDLSYSEFYDGFESNPITEYAFSVGTVVNYIHYQLTFPNENCRIKTSGNYRIKVFEDNNPEKVLFTAQFYVVEPQANIEIQLLRPEIPRYLQRYQQYKIKLVPNCNDSHNLREEITTLIVQNLNPYTTQKCYLSELREGKVLIYDDPDSNLFLAGNEFRYFDTKNFKALTPRIQSTKYLNAYYEIYLTPEEWRHRARYSREIDMNGKFLIANQQGTNKDRDADYVMVHFTLPTPEPLMEGQLYLIGGFNGWQCNQQSRLSYNLDEKAYKTSMLLKQGYYNYLIAYRTDNGQVNFSYAEGDHFETENDYYVFVYYHAYTARYQRLIGYTMINSLQK